MNIKWNRLLGLACVFFASIGLVTQSHAAANCFSVSQEANTVNYTVSWDSGVYRRMDISSSAKPYVEVYEVNPDGTHYVHATARYPATSAAVVVSKNGLHTLNLRVCRSGECYNQLQNIVTGNRTPFSAVVNTTHGLASENLAPFVSFENTAVFNSVAKNQSITISAKATDIAVPGLLNKSSRIQKVEFYVGQVAGNLMTGNNLVSTDTTASSGSLYSFTYTPRAAGDYFVAAVAYDELNEKSYVYQAFHVAEPQAATGPVASGPQLPWHRYDLVWLDRADDPGVKDLYVHGKKTLILLHGNIITPITIPAPAGFIFYANEKGGFDEASPFEFTQNSLNDCLARGECQSVADAELAKGDINGDGRDDLFVPGADNADSSLLLSGAEVSEQVEVLVQVRPTGQVQVGDNAPSHSPLFAGNLQGANVSLANNSFQVAGQSFSFNEVRGIAAPTTGPNDNIAAAPVARLPSTTVSGKDQALLDGLSQVSGEFRVNEMGAATYSIPIDVPQGTAGVTPSFNIHYSSQQGDGLMGLGWSLGAGGSISRCRQTVLNDGKAKPITFTGEDRFCLNGTRLLLVKGTYGTNDSQYRTDIDSGVLVVAKGGSIGSPDYFKVMGKDGSVSFYGAAGNSTSEQKGYARGSSTPNNDRIMSWGLSRFEDSVSNAITYHYTQTQDQYHLASVKYGYGAGSDAAVTVAFSYGERFTTPSWVMGYRFADNSLLNKVTITDSNQALGEYTFTYNAKAYAPDRLKRLSTVDYCIGTSCAKPLQLDWGTSKAVASSATPNPVTNEPSATNIFNFSEDKDVTLSASKIISHVPLDFNGDGLMDLVTMSENNGFWLSAVVQRPNGTFSKFLTNVGEGLLPHLGFRASGSSGVLAGSETPRIVPIDFNMDGRSDLAVYSLKANKWTALFSTPVALSAAADAIDWQFKSDADFLPNVGRTGQFADLNADGLVDLIYVENFSETGQRVMYRLLERNSEPDTSSKAYSYSPAKVIPGTQDKIIDTTSFTVGDLDNDGKVEVYSLAYQRVAGDTNPSSCALDVKLYVFDIDGVKSANANNSNQPLSLFDNVKSRDGLCSEAFKEVEIRKNKFSTKTETYHDRYGEAQYYIATRMAGLYLVDANNDGAVDIVYSAKMNDTGGMNGVSDHDLYMRKIYFLPGLGNGKFESRQELITPDNNFFTRYRSFLPMDVNMDGKMDFIVNGDTDKKMAYTYSSWSHYPSRTILFPDPNRGNTSYTDLNGDGALERIVSSYKNGKLTITQGIPKGNTVVTRFKTGLNNVTAIQYEPLRSSGSYLPTSSITVNFDDDVHEQIAACHDDNEANWDPEIGNYRDCSEHNFVDANADSFYEHINNPFKTIADEMYVFDNTKAPVMELLGSAMPVVTQVGSTAPSHNNNDQLAVVDYVYEGLRVQAGGRGMLGFKSLGTLDRQTGTRTTTRYRQDWPFIGRPYETVTKAASGQLLKLSQSTMGLLQLEKGQNGSGSQASFKVSAPSSNTIPDVAKMKTAMMQSVDRVSSALKLKTSQGTSSVGPVIVYTHLSNDITFNVPAGQVKSANPAEATGATSTGVLSHVATKTFMDDWNNVNYIEAITSQGGQFENNTYTGGKTLKTQITNNTYFTSTVQLNGRGYDGAHLGRLSKSTVETTRDVNGTARTMKREATFTYDNFGGSCKGEGSNPFVGLLCTEQVNVVTYSGPDNSTAYTNSQTPPVTKHYYDKFGNKTFTKTGTRVSGYTEYDDLGRYPLATYGVFSQKVPGGDATPPGYSVPAGAKVFKTSEVITRSKHGTPLLTRSTVGNGRSVYTTAAVTEMGTVFFEGNSTGAFSETRMAYGAGNACPSNTEYRMLMSKAGGAKSGTCHDRVGRTVGKFTQLFDGGYSRVEQKYDILGRVVEASEPSKDSAPTAWTKTRYDTLSRPTRIIHPFLVTDSSGESQDNAAVTTIQYDGFATVSSTSGVKGKDNRVKREVKNALGELVKITEQYGLTGERSISYLYDVQGKLEQTISPKGDTATGNKVEIYYNGLGQKYKMVDPDKGTWDYTYNQYGDLIEQTDAMSQVTTIKYDFAGRKISSFTKGVGTNRDVELKWIYDVATYGLGKLSREENVTERFSQQMTYDALGRISNTVTSLPGKDNVQESFYQKQTYDALGRPFQTFDAARIGADFNYNGVQNEYNSFGYLTKVREAKGDASNSHIFYEVKAMDARGNVTETIYGDGNIVTHRYNSVTGNLVAITRNGPLGTNQTYLAKWDHLGNLVERKDNFSGNVPETFTYDEHNRLKSNKVGTKTVNMVYYLNDNIRKKSDEQSNSEYKYGKNNHAVTQIGQRKFTYDKNGNVTQDSGNGKVKTFTYTATDQAASISLSTGHTTQFSYGTAGRFKRVDKDGSSRITTTLYVGNVEKVYNADNTIQYKRTVGGVAQLTYTVAAGKLGTADYKYLHKDHLGSINAITYGSGSQKGLVYQRMAFDPWGARRDLPAGKLSNNALNPTSVLASFAKTQRPTTNRGFTGHEMLDEVGIIHMNGRIYDASIARFLQADPNVDGVTRVSGFNRYAYGGNNPLNGTDPSGYGWLSKAWKKLKPFVGVILGVVVAFVCQVCGASIINAALTGAAIGAVSAGVNGGNILRGALMGFVSGAAFSAIGQGFADCGGCQAAAGKGVFGTALKFGAFAGKVAAHATAGGVMSVLNGGKFGHGFAAAGVTQAFSGAIDGIGAGEDFFSAGNRAIRVIAAATLGGTASKLSGGKFANGAITGAFSRAFNDEAHLQKNSRIPDGFDDQEEFDRFLSKDQEGRIKMIERKLQRLEANLKLDKLIDQRQVARDRYSEAQYEKSLTPFYKSEPSVHVDQVVQTAEYMLDLIKIIPIPYRVGVLNSNAGKKIESFSAKETMHYLNDL